MKKGKRRRREEKSELIWVHEGCFGAARQGNLFGVVSGWVGLGSKHTPSHSTSSYTVTKPKLDLPTKFHPNRTKIAKVCYWGGFGVGG